MPPTPQSRRLAEAHRLAQVRLSAQTQALSNTAWRILDPSRIGATSDRWMTLMNGIVRRQRQLSAGLAGDYYQRVRALTLDGDILPALASSVTTAEVEASMTATALDRLTSPPAGQPWETTVRNARNGAARSAARLALDGGRGTILGTVQTDRQSLGWTRIGSDGPCAFCLMTISRGPVYRSESSASFHAHDGCHCVVAVAFVDDDLWTEQAEAARHQYDAAIDAARASDELQRGTSNDSLNALRRSLAAN